MKKIKTFINLFALLLPIIFILTWLSCFFIDDVAKIARTAATFSLWTYFEVLNIYLKLGD